MFEIYRRFEGTMSFLPSKVQAHAMLVEMQKKQEEEMKLLRLKQAEEQKQQTEALGSELNRMLAELRDMTANREATMSKFLSQSSIPPRPPFPPPDPPDLAKLCESPLLHTPAIHPRAPFSPNQNQNNQGLTDEIVFDKDNTAWLLNGVVTQQSKIEFKVESIETGSSIQQIESSGVKDVISTDLVLNNESNPEGESRPEKASTHKADSVFGEETITSNASESSQVSLYHLPVFDGTFPDCWIAKVDRFFELKQYGNEEKLDLIYLSVEGAALKWFRRHRREFTDWTDIKRKLMARFGLVKGFVVECDDEESFDVREPSEVTVEEIIDKSVDMIREEKSTPENESSPVVSPQILLSQFQVSLSSLEPGRRYHKESLVVINDLSCDLGCVIGKTNGCICDSELGQANSHDEEEFKGLNLGKLLKNEGLFSITCLLGLNDMSCWTQLLRQHIFPKSWRFKFKTESSGEAILLNTYRAVCLGVYNRNLETDLEIFLYEYKNQMLMLGYHGLEVQVLSCLQEFGEGSKMGTHIVLCWKKLASSLWFLHGKELLDAGQKMQSMLVYDEEKNGLRNTGAVNKKEKYIFSGNIKLIKQSLSGDNELIWTQFSSLVKASEMSLLGHDKWKWSEKHRMYNKAWKFKYIQRLMLSVLLQMEQYKLLQGRTIKCKMRKKEVLRRIKQSTFIEMQFHMKNNSKLNFQANTKDAELKTTLTDMDTFQKPLEDFYRACAYDYMALRVLELIKDKASRKKKLYKNWWFKYKFNTWLSEALHHTGFVKIIRTFSPMINETQWDKETWVKLNPESCKGGSLLEFLKRHEARFDMIKVPNNTKSFNYLKFLVKSYTLRIEDVLKGCKFVKFTMEQSEKPLITILSYEWFHSPRPPELSCCKEDEESTARIASLRTRMI